MSTLTWEAVIFDLDGVICSTDEFHYFAWKEIADSLNIPFDRDTNNLLRGVSRKESLDIILHKGGITLNEVEKDALCERKNEIYRNYLNTMSPSSLSREVKNTLDTLRLNGLKLAIGSSSKNTKFILEKIGLGKYFNAVADGECITRSKPDPEVFLKAAQMLKENPSRCIVVEDAVSGAKAAHLAGMDVACVGEAAKKKAGDYNLDSFSDLINVICM